MKTEKYLGLDVHKADTEIAVADGGRSGEVRVYGKVSSDLVTTERALRKIRGDEGVLTPSRSGPLKLQFATRR